MNITAGISIKYGIKKIGIKVIILEVGNMIIYAPIIPEIAPDAPIAGIVEFALKIKWVKLAKSRITNRK